MSTKTKRKTQTKAAKKTRPRATKKRTTSAKKPENKPVVAEPIPDIRPSAPEKVFLLVVRLLGPMAVPVHIETTMRSLRLDRRFSAVLAEKSPSIVGMLNQAKDYLTWGEPRTQDIAKLLRRRGELIGGAAITEGFVKESFGQQSIDELAVALSHGQIDLKALWKSGVKRVFRMRAPSGGFQYSVKRPFATRGELGNRGPHISDLLNDMA
jgi:large subunit ribosomal protein L30